MHRMVAPSDFAVAVRKQINRRSKGRFFTPKRLAQRVPFEVLSLVMLGLVVAIYILLQFAQPSALKLP